MRQAQQPSPNRMDGLQDTLLKRSHGPNTTANLQRYTALPSNVAKAMNLRSQF